MNIKLLKSCFLITAVILFDSMFVYASNETPKVSQISGKIMWVDVKQGKVEIKLNQSSGEKKEYRITRNETRVKDPSDKKFLTIDDLRTGEHVTFDVIEGQEDKIVQKIVTESLGAADFQESSGELKSYDTQAGTLTLEEKMRNGQHVNSELAYFFFEPKDVVVLESSNIQPSEIELKAGDRVKIQFVLKDEKKQIYSITLYPSEVTSTTTTTVTTTTQ